MPSSIADLPRCSRDGSTSTASGRAVRCSAAGAAARTARWRTDANARIDRIDQLTDGRLVIIDYKSSAPSVAAWDGDRPDEPQVPLYAISTAAPLAAVAFAQVQTGDTFFRGLGTEPFVLPGLKATPLDEVVERWRTVLSRLAEEFRSGRAAVDPKERDTCKFCSQHALCRIDESR